ncbi:rhamnulokinase [Geodermatophilus sabuli]|uniref:Rhamnulokinase n=1 Tax=Geodermatophilus sabuli TaxID=1564158 RepID=A0A285EJM4_9ACTN|nr:rhamnulokinase family protein [Geodermatophilus sabuli]MBB3083805.1 rhamnulokinase [Geodermatophilus sabuli]SNX99318.1 rhamnulokinase [Geodermatophilus sabuli]
MGTAVSSTFAAVDLGASSGRVIAARVGPGRLELTEAYRFPNRPVRTGGTLHWDVLGLYAGVLDGLRAAGRAAGRLAGVGIDSWAVDVGLLDADGALLGNPLHYRDARHATAVPAVHAVVPPEQLYRTTGLQHLPFNTVFQLAAARGTAQLAAARTALLVPDLLAYWLTGSVGAEVTNASTTGLLDATSREWAGELIDRLGFDRGLFPPLRWPGDRVGELTADVLAETGLTGPVPVTAVGSHDTASAVVGVPATSDRFAYVSCGTWSLVGVELDRPVLSDASRAAGFTNELGVDGTVRYLRNVMGLWLLQESLRTWAAHGLPAELPEVLAAAARVPAFTALVDPDDPRFLPPGDMPARIAAVCAETGQTPPKDQAETVRCILDSLALAYRRSVRRAVQLAGRDVEVVHLVGGGARNALLCQLTADACGLPVVAGPVEAAALGNALVQARAAGVLDGGLPGLRALLRETSELHTYTPSGSGRAWDAAEARLDRRH